MLNFEGLSLDQLRTARQRLESVIHTREAEKRHGVWVVKNWIAPVRWFREDEYVEAVEYMAKLARRLDEAGERINRRELSIEYRLLPDSEYTRVDFTQMAP